MAEGMNLIIAGDLEDKRSWDVEDGKMFCATIVGRGFTHEQYLTPEVFALLPEVGEQVRLFGAPKVNKKGNVTIGMKACQVAAAEAAPAGRSRRAAA